MLRKLLVTAPWTQVDEFPEALRSHGLSLDDYGWISKDEDLFRREGRERRPADQIPESERLAMAVVVFDDDLTSAPALVEEMCDWVPYPVELNQNIVFMPDGLEAARYEELWPLCERLHEAERKAASPDATASDVDLVQTLREALQPILNLAYQDGVVATKDFLTSLLTLLKGMPEEP